MSELYQSLSHSKWDCKYHIVLVPKYRRKVMFGEIRKFLEPIFHELARQKECRMIEGHLMPDHVHMCIEIPPKHSVASVIGFIKGKSAIASFCWVSEVILAFKTHGTLISGRSHSKLEQLVGAISN
jgi:putative transposase